MTFSVRIATKDDIESVVSIVRRDFYSEETIFKCFYLSNQSINTEGELEKMNEDLYNLTSDSISYGPCLIVFDNDNNEIIGVLTMIGSENPNLDVKDKTFDFYTAQKPKSKVMTEYLNYVIEMSEDIDIFAEFPGTKNCLEICTCAISKNHRTRGLATLLVKEALEYARKNCFDVLSGLFTSPYSIKLAENLGLKSIVNFDLTKYVDSRGFKPDSKFLLHNNVSIMAIRLDQRNNFG